MKLIIALFAFSTLTGCATYISKNDCLKDNFYKKAKKVAYKGFKASIYNNYQESCKKHGIEVESVTFTKGWTEGMKEFCTEHRGFHWGITRKSNPNICSEELKPYFEKGYKKGKLMANGRRRNKKG